MKVNYVVEPSRLALGYDWVAAYDEAGKLICEPVTWKNAEKAKEVYEQYDAAPRLKRRRLLEALGFAPYIQDACRRELIDYAQGLLCAAQVVRAADKKTELVGKIFGAMPDMRRRTQMILLDSGTEADREAYLEGIHENWGSFCHPAHRVVFHRWVKGELNGYDTFEELLYYDANLRLVTTAISNLR